MTWPDWLTRYGSLGRSVREIGDQIDAAVTARDRQRLNDAAAQLLAQDYDLAAALNDMPEGPEA